MAKKITPSTTVETTTQTAASSPVGKNTTIPITLKWNQIEPIYDRTVNKLSHRLKLDGFRKGKVPAQLAEGAVGFEKIRDAVLDEMLSTAYQAAIKETNKQPLTRPHIEIVTAVKGSDWELEAQIAEAPQIKLGAYKDVVKTAKKEAAEEIKKTEAELKKAKTTPADKEPEHDHEHDHAHDHDHDHKTARALSDEEKKDQTLRIIFKNLVTTVNPIIPELLLQEETRYDLEQLVKTLDQLKFKLDDYLGRRQMSFEQLTSEMAASALGRLQLEFILSQIADEEKIEASETEVDQEIAQLKDEKMREQQKANPAYRRYVAGLLTRRKVTEYLLGL